MIRGWNAGALTFRPEVATGFFMKTLSALGMFCEAGNVKEKVVVDLAPSDVGVLGDVDAGVPCFAGGNGGFRKFVLKSMLLADELGRLGRLFGKNLLVSASHGLEVELAELEGLGSSESGGIVPSGSASVAFGGGTRALKTEGEGNGGVNDRFGSLSSLMGIAGGTCEGKCCTGGRAGSEGLTAGRISVNLRAISPAGSLSIFSGSAEDGGTSEISLCVE